jgi:hypothetical protein
LCLVSRERVVVTQKRTPEVTSDRGCHVGMSPRSTSSPTPKTFNTLISNSRHVMRTVIMELPTPTIKQSAQKAIKSNITIQNTLTTKVTELEAQLKELDELIVSCSLSWPYTRFNSPVGFSSQRRGNRGGTRRRI